MRARALVNATEGKSGIRAQLTAKGLRLGAPVFLRAFKHTDLSISGQKRYPDSRDGMTMVELLDQYFDKGSLEVWVFDSAKGKYVLFKTYPVVALPGRPGPKRAYKDLQGVEGFYNISVEQMVPWSKFFLAFNVGYPNAFDCQHSLYKCAKEEAPKKTAWNQSSTSQSIVRPGDAVMVHGADASEGCLAMTDAKIPEIYVMVEAALNTNERVGPDGAVYPYHVPFHSFPFPMKEVNLRRFTRAEIDDLSKDLEKLALTPLGVEGFWANLKEGYDYFEGAEREGSPHVLPEISIVGEGSSAEYRISDSRSVIRERTCEPSSGQSSHP